jgi:leucyl/phenylalanyl-tRNA--protein transferase
MSRRIPAADEFLAAYAAGWFPMDVDGRIGFYECDPRAVIPIAGFRRPKSVVRALRDVPFDVRIDHAFDETIAACGGERMGGLWLTPRLVEVYRGLHRSGWAHSVEIWLHGHLVGGLFGVAMGGLFTSESMFHRVANAGNAALVATHTHLLERGYVLWDIQMVSDHTTRFGAIGITPDEYREQLEDALVERCDFAP